MNPEFFDFISNPSKENFTKSREIIINHPAYNPYSDDLEIIEKFIEEADYESAINCKNINILLSPTAHLMKGYAAKQLNNENALKAEYDFANSILDCIRLTGNGSKEQPYIVTRVEDEYEVLHQLKEKVSSQNLIIEEEKIFDLIKTESRKQIYFDITDCYNKLNGMNN